MGINQHRLVTGDIESIKLFSKLIVQRLNGKLTKEGNSNSAHKVSNYIVDIMGNTINLKSVQLKVIEDSRDNTGEIKIEHGSEYINWQISINKLCDCCAYNISKSLVFSVCYKAAEPNETIKTGQCKGYKFSSKKYNEYLDRKDKKR